MPLLTTGAANSRARLPVTIFNNTAQLFFSKFGITTVDKVVVIPTYNEKENIISIIQAVLALPEDFHVLVIDDGSPDGTAQLVKDFERTVPGKLFIE